MPKTTNFSISLYHDLRHTLSLAQRQFDMLQNEALTPAHNKLLNSIYLLDKVIEKHKE